MHNNEIIHALKNSAREIRSLRRHLIDLKAEAWDVHSEVIRQMFRGPQTTGLCPAAWAEKLAKELEVVQEPDSADTTPL